MCRELQTRLTLLRPETTILHKQVAQKFSHDRCGQFLVADRVFARNLCTSPEWMPSTVMEVLGPVTYTVEADEGMQWKCHANQLKDRLLSR